MLYFAVYAIAEIRRESVELFFEHISSPCDETGCLGIKEVYLLNILQGYAFAVVGRYAPPCLFAEAADAVDDAIQESSPTLHNLSHHESCQMTALLETDGFIVHPVARYLVLGKNSPGQSSPCLSLILFTIFYIALLHLLRDGVTPEGIVSLW